ncbi:MAG: DUF2066 domain-containing protein [Gammaproteobacteria bacterium]|nr:DUF2066 domain-containing protein [Gammaproteobacteria bacterium]
MRNTRFNRLFLLSIAGFVHALAPAPIAALEVSGLYEAEVVVADKSEASREAGLGDALALVITKVTGRRNPKTNPVIAEAAANPGRFVQQFRYRQEEALADSAFPAPRRWYLWARFDAGVVDGLVEDAGWQLWGRLRPEVMLWIALERSGERRLLGGEESPELAAVVRDAARLRGVPVVLPLLDLEDQAQVRASDVWGGFQDRIRAASARYQANVILVARVYRLLPSIWEGKFMLMVGDDIQEWSEQGDILELLLSDAVNELADRLAQRFARPGVLAGAEGLDLVVNGVRSVSDYARTLEYLGALEQITDVNVTRVVADEVKFRVQAKGDRNTLLNVIRVGGVLSPESLPEDLQWRFRLLR